MAQFRFVVDGDFVDFYDGAMHAFRVRNTTQDVDWYYETAPGIKFEVDGHRYNTVPSQIEIDGVTLSANTDFDDAIVGIFPNLASGVGPGGTPGIDSVLAEAEDLTANRTVTLGANTLNFTGSAGSAINITVDDITIIGDIQYNGNAKLLSGLTMNLDGHFFEMLNAEGVHSVFVADATVGAERIYIQATNDANGGSFALLSAETNETQTLVTLQSDFQDGTKDAQLVLRTASGESTITHTADSHTFNVEDQFLVTDGSGSFFSTTKLSTVVSASDGTALSSLTVQGDALDPSVRFTLSSNNGVGNPVSIEGSGQTSTITHTADTHTFNAQGQPNLVVGLELTQISAFNPTDDNNNAGVGVSTDAATATFSASASFNDGVKLALIVGFADATTAKITATGDVIIADLAGGGTTGLSIDNDGKIIRTP